MLMNGVSQHVFDLHFFDWVTDFEIDGLIGGRWVQAGHVAGALFACIIFRFVNRQIMLAMSYLLVSLMMMLAVSIKSFSWDVIFLVIQGFFVEVAYVAILTIVCETWKDKIGQIVQAMYFCYSLSIIVRRIHFPEHPSESLEEMRIPAFIASGFVIFSGLLLVPLISLIKKDDQIDSRNKNNQRTIFVVIISAILIAFFSLTEMIYWTLIHSYLSAVRKVSEAFDMQEKLFYIQEAACGLAIPLVLKVSPYKVLLIDFGVIFLSCIGLLLTNSLQMLWLCTIMIGGTFATIYPQLLAFTTKEINLTNFIMSILIFSREAMKLIYVVSDTVTWRNDQFMVWFLLIFSLISAGVLQGLPIFLRKFFAQRNVPNDAQDLDLLNSQSFTRLQELDHI